MVIWLRLWLHGHISITGNTYYVKIMQTPSALRVTYHFHQVKTNTCYGFHFIGSKTTFEPNSRLRSLTRIVSMITGHNLKLARARSWHSQIGRSMSCILATHISLWHFKNLYELLPLRALKISMFHKNFIFQYMGKIFCVELQRYPLKFHTKYLTHTLKDAYFIHKWKFKSS